jgi:hypothetical protein
LGVKATVTDMYNSLKGERERGGGERVRAWESNRERRQVRCKQIMLVTTQEQQQVSEPIATKYLQF